MSTSSKVKCLLAFAELSKRISKISWWLLSHLPTQYERVEIEEEREEFGEKNFLERVGIR